MPESSVHVFPASTDLYNPAVAFGGAVGAMPPTAPCVVAAYNTSGLPPAPGITAMRANARTVKVEKPSCVQVCPPLTDLSRPKPYNESAEYSAPRCRRTLHPGR